MEFSRVLFALLPTIAGLFVGAGLQYLFGRTLELRKQLQMAKGSAYSDYCRAFASIATAGRSKEALGQLADAKTRVCIYGSPLVVERLAEFERSGSNTGHSSSRHLVWRLVLAMRQDIGGRSATPAEGDLEIILLGPEREV